MTSILDFFTFLTDAALLLVVLRTGNIIEGRTHWTIKLSYFVLAVGVFAHLLRFVPAVDRMCSVETLHATSDILISIGILCVLQFDRRGPGREGKCHRFRPGNTL